MLNELNKLKESYASRGKLGKTAKAVRLYNSLKDNLKDELLGIDFKKVIPKVKCLHRLKEFNECAWTPKYKKALSKHAAKEFNILELQYAYRLAAGLETIYV